MPNNIVKSFAEKSGKSVDEVEKMWNAVSDSIKKQDPKVKEDDNFYKKVVGILKKNLSIDEDAVVTTTSMGGSSAIYAKKMGSTSKDDNSQHPGKDPKTKIFKRLNEALNNKKRREGTLLEQLEVMLEEGIDPHVAVLMAHTKSTNGDHVGKVNSAVNNMKERLKYGILKPSQVEHSLGYVGLSLKSSHPDALKNLHANLMRVKNDK